VTPLLWIIGVFLAVVSVIDLKFRQSPSIMLTGALFVAVAINPLNLIFGALAGLLALLLYEGEFIGGLGDIKVMIIIGMMINNMFWFFAFAVLIGIFGLSWKAMLKLRIKKAEEFAFIPVFFFVYVAMAILGGVA